MSLQVVVSVCWNTSWRGYKWSPVMSNWRWENCFCYCFCLFKGPVHCWLQFMSKCGFCSCFWCIRCWRSLSTSVVMGPTISSQNSEGTPPSSSKHPVRFFSFVRSTFIILLLPSFIDIHFGSFLFDKFTAALLIPSMAQHYMRKWGIQHRYDMGCFVFSSQYS